ncbi:hypothetical protein K1X76_02885 [bacterium]|nr:hypothetical protein [bacterium]
MLQLLLTELDSIKLKFQDNVACYWDLKKKLDWAKKESGECSFLSRRLHTRFLETEEEFEVLLNELNELVQQHLHNSHLLPLSSLDDVQDALKLRRKIRYLRNAYAHNNPVIEDTLKKLTRALPR